MSSVPHPLTLARHAAAAAGGDVHGPGTVGRCSQGVRAVAPEAEMLPIEGAVVQAVPGETGGEGGAMVPLSG